MTAPEVWNGQMVRYIVGARAAGSVRRLKWEPEDGEEALQIQERIDRADLPVLYLNYMECPRLAARPVLAERWRAVRGQTAQP